jgi:hypothetical protein
MGRQQNKEGSIAQGPGRGTLCITC